MLTIFTSYGDVNGYRQADIMRSFARPVQYVQDSEAPVLVLIETHPSEHHHLALAAAIQGGSNSTGNSVGGS